MSHMRHIAINHALHSLRESTVAIRVLLAASLLLALSIPGAAGSITWTTWTAHTTGNSGSATGTIGSVGVSYTGQVASFYPNYPSWTPVSTYAGGTVSNAPSPKEIVGLTGGSATGTATITFSQPVVDPVMAIWSLGAGGTQAEFLFTSSEPFSIQAGGPSAEYGGSSIFTGGTCPANAVCGKEGNGTIQFSGTFTSLTWTNPAYENWYGFDAGIAGVATPTVPEPSSLVLFGAGMLALSWLVRRRRFRTE